MNYNIDYSNKAIIYIMNYNIDHNNTTRQRIRHYDRTYHILLYML